VIACIIPARGGSTGIPHKNIIPVCGKPLIAWTIEQAQAATLIDEVIVSTDADEISFAAGHYGCEVFRRSADTATATASSESCLREVIQAKYRHAELIVFLQATSPIRQPHDIDAAIDLLRCTHCDSLFSARRVHGYTWERRASGTIVPRHSQRLPRQAEQVQRWEENGSIYVFKPWVLDAFNLRLGGLIGVYEMDPLDSFQIDEPEDIPVIEQLLELRLGVGRIAAPTI